MALVSIDADALSFQLFRASELGVSADQEQALREQPPRDDESRWRVTATVTFGSRFGAIINDVLFYVGDSVPGGVRLTSVEKNRVVLTDPKGAVHTIAVKEG